MMKKRKIKAVLFDFDGTLVNTNDVIIESFQETYRHYYGHEVEVEKITRVFGEPLEVTMARDFPMVKPIEAMEYYRQYQHLHADKLLKGFPEIPELLTWLKEEGYELAIVTSRTTLSTQKYLKTLALDKFFDIIVSCDDTVKKKPNPEPIMLALDRIGIDATEAIMIGDGPFDILCANNAKVKSVLVGWRITDMNNDLAPSAKIDFEIEKPLDLIKVLEELC